MTREEFKAKVSMALGSMERETWENFLESVWQLHLEASNQWIPVEERLPEENGKTQQSISVWATDGLMSGEFRYNFDTKTWTDMWGDAFDITHWMLLPQPPRKEELDMIVQEDVPYTKKEVKAMVKTIHDLREQLKQLGWHPASELPPLDEDDCSDEVVVITSEDNDTFRHGPMIDKPSTSMVIDKEWDKPDVKWWCYPPKEE